MLVKMKQLENQCRLDTERFKKNWEFYCIAGDSWLAGFRYAQQLASTKVHDATVTYDCNCENLFPEDMLLLGCEEVEVEINNGDHQIGGKSTDNG